MLCDLTIDRLGAQGDGVANTPDGPVYVPFTLPGERVRAEVAGGRGTLVELIEPSPHRVAPPCPHFGRCGGCALQHLELDAYLAWKRKLVEAALGARGIACEIDPVRTVSTHSRRRTTFVLQRDGKSAKFCYHGRMSHGTVSIEQCLVLAPALARLISPLPQLLAPLVRSRGDAEVQLTACDNGVDVLINGAAKPAPGFLARLAGEAPSLGVIRVTVNGDLALSLETPRVNFAGAVIAPPPGAFLQAVQAAEQELADLVVAGLRESREAADLFAGMGAFTFPIARRARVTAVESDRAALAALSAASRGAGGFKPITALARDLFREPLSARELKRFDGVALDPPRAGARAPCEELARSSVERVAMASCNPASFARDARILIAGGYRLLLVAPVDQFWYSPHIELVAHFRRP